MKENCAKTCKFCQVKASITFIKEPESLVVVEGDVAAFHCEADSLSGQPIIYFWKYNGTYIKSKDEGFNISSGSLFIQNVKAAAHNGIYQCVVFSENHGSVVSRKAYLQTAYLKQLSDAARSYRARMPNPLLIKAPRLDAIPRPVFEWQYRASDGFFKAVTDGKIFKTVLGDLLIPTVTTQHNTVFRLKISHPIAGANLILAPPVAVKIHISFDVCPNRDILFYPTMKNITAIEGTNVSFECLAVAKSCKTNVDIVWSEVKSQTVLSRERRLNLWNVTKSGEGFYSCHAKVGNSRGKQELFFLKVIESPRIRKTINPILYIHKSEYIEQASVAGSYSFSWVTNAEEIHKSSKMYEITANNSLKIRYPCSSYSGLYQQFFSNEAGITLMVIQDVVLRTAGCGQKVFGLSGNVTFHSRASLGISNPIVCTWLIQTASTEDTWLKLVKLNFPMAQENFNKTQIYLFSGSPAVAVTSFANYCMTNKDNLSVSSSGPFVTIVLKTTRALVTDGEFLIKFAPYFRDARLSTTSSNRNISMARSSSLFTTATETTVSTAGSQQIVIKRKKFPVGAVIGGILTALVILVIVAVICYRKGWFRFNFKKIPAKFTRPNSNSLPRYDVEPPSQQLGLCVTRQPYPDVIPTISHLHCTPRLELGQIGPAEYQHGNETYDSVGSVISSGRNCNTEESQDYYDVVGGIMKENRQNIDASFAKNDCKQLKSYIAKPEPFYHQLDEQINTDHIDNKAGFADGNKLTRASQNQCVKSQDLDGQYTALENLNWSMKENNAYEPLTLKLCTNSKIIDRNEQLGEYCLPCDVSTNYNFNPH